MPELLTAENTIEKNATEKVRPLFSNDSDFEPIHMKLRAEATQRAIVKMVIDFVEDKNSGNANNTLFHDTLKKAEDMYRMKPDRVVEDKNLSNFGSPLVKIAVDTLTTRIKDVTFSMPESPAQIVPVDEKDEKEKGMIADAQRALTQAIHLQGDKEIRHETIIRTGFKAGDGWSKQSWEYKPYITIVEREREDPIFGLVVEENEELEMFELGPQMRWIDPKLIHFPEDCPNPLEAPWFIEEMYMRPEEIKRRIKLGEYQSIAISKDILVAKPSNLGDDPGKKERANLTTGDTGKGYKKIYDAYVMYQSPYDEWEHPWRFVVNATDKQLLRAVRNRMGQTPYAKCTPFPIENEPRGASLPMDLEQLWKYTNTIFNYIADTATFSTGPGGFYRPTETLNRKTIKISPRTFRPTRNPKEDVNAWVVPDVKQGILTTLQLILKFYEDLTGMNNAVLGQFPAGVERPTARGMSSLLGQISIKFEDINKNIQSGLARAYGQMFWMMVHIGGDEYFKRMLNVDGVATYFKTQGRNTGLPGLGWDVKVIGNPLNADKNIRQRRSLEIFQLFVPLLKARPDKVGELMDFLVRALEMPELESFTENLGNDIVNEGIPGEQITGLDERPVVEGPVGLGNLGAEGG